MVSSMDRLEKFFSRRKPSGAPSFSGTVGANDITSLSNPSDSSIPHFPQAPYIRPRSTRLQAREESARKAGAAAPSERTNSLPESTRSDRPATAGAASSNHSGSVRSTTSKAPSYLLNRREATLATLEGFDFHAHGRNGSGLPGLPSATPSPGDSFKRFDFPHNKELPPQLKLDFDSMQRFSQFLRNVSLVTPPASDFDESCTESSRGGSIRALSAIAEPTPEPSPKMSPLPAPRDATMRLQDALKLTPLMNRDSTVVVPPRRSSMRRGSICSHITVQTKQCSSRSPDIVLKEPNFEDFLSLGDDDIADGPSSMTIAPSSPRTPVSRPTSAGGSTTPRRSLTPSKLRSAEAPSGPPSFNVPPLPPSVPGSTPAQRTLPADPTSPTHRAAAAGAFATARIAAKYHFDLVYVIDVWPRRKGDRQGQRSRSSSISPVSPSGSYVFEEPLTAPRAMHRSKRSDARQAHLVARFLAGYGLANIKPPFQLSNALHSKILNHEQKWLEFRDLEAGPEEYVRGFGAAFYGGHVGASRTSSPDGGNDADAETEGDQPATTSLARGRASLRTLNNRGVIFVAYRKPGADGSDLEDVDLDALHKEVDELVGMILDSDHPKLSSVSATLPSPDTTPLRDFRQKADVFKALPPPPLALGNSQTC